MTSPTVQNCPSNITDRSNSLQKAITWTAPTFTDNVAVVSVLSNREPGFTMDTYTSLRVQYTASDAAGNIVYCAFIITLEGIAAIMGLHSTMSLLFITSNVAFQRPLLVYLIVGSTFYVRK